MTLLPACTSSASTDQTASTSLQKPERHHQQTSTQQQHAPARQQQQHQHVPAQAIELTIHQAKFAAEGFASTVWDSAIVVAKYAEKHAARMQGKRVLDLSAGCGLVGKWMGGWLQGWQRGSANARPRVASLHA